mmetsp:Transcript_28900/g.90404  ORF Transcript_28900/g.90404 Transcript_28900/m.90404 type:complete len:194 (+) Transcript_28900:49-630(+)
MSSPSPSPPRTPRTKAWEDSWLAATRACLPQRQWYSPPQKTEQKVDALPESAKRLSRSGTPPRSTPIAGRARSPLAPLGSNALAARPAAARKPAALAPVALPSEQVAVLGVERGEAAALASASARVGRVRQLACFRHRECVVLHEPRSDAFFVRLPSLTLPSADTGKVADVFFSLTRGGLSQHVVTASQEVFL